MKKALVLFEQKIRQNKWDVKLVVNVHDELQWETTPELAEVTGKACVESIEEAGKFFNLRCPVTGEYKYGYSWRETH